MSLIPFEGSVVSYEFLGAKREWLWGIGTVTCSDERVCVIKQWVGALVDKTSTAKLESEAALSKAEAKAQQVRLLAIRERIDSQNSETSKEEKERTSQDLSECLALIGKHRNHSRSLLADIEGLKASSTVQVNVQQFTPASSSVAILRSSILQVISPTEVPSVFLSSEEVDAIEKAATHSRSQLNDELDRLRSTVEAADTESTDLHLKIRALEEQLKLLGNTSRPARLPEDGRSDSVLSEKHERLESWDSWQMWDNSAALVVSDHAITFPWNDGDTLLHHKPEETKSILTAEAAFACCVPIQCVTNPKLAARGKHLSVAFSVSHPASVTPKEIDERLAKCGFPSIHRLHEEPMGAKTGLDRAIEDLEHALGIPEGKHEGFHFDEFMESLPDTTFSNDKDAYESEIGDLLMLLDKLNNENRSLQYTLEKSAAELKKQVTAAQKDRDERCIEVARLRDIVGKLKDLAEQQEKELEENRLHSQLVRQARFCHNLALPAAEAENSVYAVTIDEYKRQKEATDAVQAAFEKEKSKADEMYRRLQEQEDQCAQHAGHLRILENALTAENDQTAKKCGAIESELVDILLQLKASDATVAALQQLNKQQQAELKSFRANRNAALAARDADGTLPVAARPLPADEAAVRALDPQEIADGPLYAVTLEEYRDKDAALEQLAAELDAQRADAQRLADEVAAFRAHRNAALAARDADGTLPVAARPLPADEAAVCALDPQEIADGPLYAVTLEEYRDKDAALEQLAAELGAQRADAQRLADEVAAFRAHRNAALAARDADGTLPVAARPLPADEAAVCALDPQEIADGPLYAVTLEEYRDKDAALEQLAAELGAQRADAQRLADEVAAFRAHRNAALAARDADGTLPVAARPLPADEAAVCALDPQEIADGPLYAVTLEELQQVREDAIRSAEVIDDNAGAVESELLDVLAQLKALEGENAALAALCVRKGAAVADLEKHDVRAQNSDKSKPQTSSRHQKVFEGDEWDTVVETRPHALHDAFVMDVCTACRVGREDLSDIRFALGSLQASVTVTHNSEISCDDIAKLVEEYHYPNVWSLYARRSAPKDGLDEARDTISMLESALAAQRADAQRLADELAAQRADAQRLADEVAAFRAHRNAALAARDADGTLPVAARPLPADEAAVCALDPQEIADGPLYAVTLEEYRDKDAALEQLAAELGAQRADAQRLADEVAAFRAHRNAALAARDADGTLPVAARPLPADEAAVCALDPQEIADGPLYAVTLEELQQARDTISMLESALAAQRADAQRLADEVAAFRAHRNAALAARDADGTLPVAARPLPADEAAVCALDPQEIADGPLYAVTLEEYRDKDAALEQLAAELGAQRADAQRLADEVAAFRAHRNAALAARDADGTLPVAARPLPADEAAVCALDPQEIADGPLYAVTLEELQQARDTISMLESALAAQRADAQRLADEVAAFRAHRNAALAARDADGTLPVAARPLPADEAAVCALDPQEIADGPLYAVTLEEYRDKDAALEQLAAELGAQRADAQRLADEVAAFRAHRNAALAARDADGTLPVAARPLPADEAAVRALDPQEIADGPLYAVTLEELREQRVLNAEMVEEFEALAERVRAAMDPKLFSDRASDDVIFYLETLVTALEQSRDAEQVARDAAEERERELTKMRKLFENEEERFKSDLEEAREEVERLQGELDLLTDKLDEACRLFGDADAVNAEGVAKLEAFAEVLAAARDAEKDAVEQLEAKESELEELRIALREAVGREEALEKLEDEVALLQKEKDIMETELSAAQKEMNDLRHDLRAAEDRAEDKTREVERMTLDLDALNIRIQDLLEELEEKTDQYNQVIRDLDDFAKNQSRGNEKELLQQLAAREQELFELLEARRGENDEHEKQVGVLQDQINRLRDQTEQDNTLYDGLQGELARLRQLLADTESALRDKTAENESLRDDIEGMMDEHEAQMCEMEQELEGKSKEVSEALERLEEMSAMVQEAREGEESALRLRADSDAEVFRLQKELDKMKQLQSAMAESGDDKGRLLAQMLDTEGQLRDAEATMRKKDVERGEAEKEWREKLKTSEGLNVDLRRLLKQTMSALSKSRDTMGNSAGALDAFRDELKPMLQ
ncbi:hypothetical protein JIQ42_01584 [Leishmania sp. Namibia]|uniref:hypothetical protein n=1 Tax=Leishmania sp. Namibia TaxID=2802991 RepID=UPI001B42E7B7|nr:hypothetical protein JIQ42_01584 [Leishmania sp. Namibia]